MGYLDDYLKLQRKKLIESFDINTCHAFYVTGYKFPESRLVKGMVDEDLTYKNLKDAINNSHTVYDLFMYKKNELKLNTPYTYYVYAFDTNESDEGPWTPFYAGSIEVKFYDMDDRKNMEWSWKENIFNYNEACVADVSPNPAGNMRTNVMTTNPLNSRVDLDDIKQDLTWSPYDVEDENVLNEAVNEKMTKRQRIEKRILDVINMLDKTGTNGKYYKAFLGKMSDKEFNSYMEKFLHDDDENFYMEVQPNRNEPTFNDIKNAADYLGIELDEYIYYKHDGHKDNPIRTAYKVPVGYIPIQRMQQTLSKKNTYSLNISNRNLKTGNLTGEDKIARFWRYKTLLIAGNP